MQSRKLFYLLGLLVLSLLYGIKLFVDGRSRLEIVSTNLPELIRQGYDLVDDNSAFTKICQLLNDSLLNYSSKNICMVVITSINEVNSTIDWDLSYTDNDLRVSDRRYFFLNLNKEGLKAQGLSIRLSDIRDMVKDYIFYPDSADRKKAFIEVYVDRIGKLEISAVCADIKVPINEAGSFSISDWHLFFGCLRELIKLCEDERNKMSLKMWEKEYATLSFEEKSKIAEFAGYNIIIEFD